MKKYRLCILCVILLYLLSLTGCEITWKSPGLNNQMLVSDDNARNDIFFAFDEYNVLEVIVSDSEKFILYDFEDDDKEYGIGEWIKNGISYPVAFYDYDCDPPNRKHANIVICRDNYPGVYYDSTIISGMPPVIAMINNNHSEPGLYRWLSGEFPYNWQFEDTKVPIECSLYTRDDLCKRIYIPEKAIQFYSFDTAGSTFIVEELNLRFEGKTGKGTWILNDTSIPILASFNEKNFTFSVCYDTTDERDGVLIFSGIGTTVNDLTESQAIFVLTQVPSNCHYNAISTITMQKIE